MFRHHTEEVVYSHMTENLLCGI